MRWINVDGLGDLGVIRALAEKYHLHPLAIEDVLHVPQRPKVQAYEEDGGVPGAAVHHRRASWSCARASSTPSRSASSSATRRC